MKTKRYRNRKTGLIFKNNDYGSTDYYSEQEGMWRLPAAMVEGSCDFEELSPILFTTEDGVAITDYNTVLYNLNKKTFEAGKNIEYRFINPIFEEVIRFSSKEARDKYILLNKPVFSMQDVMDYVVGEGFNKNLIESLPENFPNLVARAKKKLNATS